MAKVSDFVRKWCAEVMWREILPRSLDRESQRNCKVRDFILSLLVCPIVEICEGLSTISPCLIPATAISPRPHWIPFDLQS